MGARFQAHGGPGLQAGDRRQRTYAAGDKLVNPQRNTGHLAEALRVRHVAVTNTYYDKVTHMTLMATIAAPMRWLAPTLDAVTTFVQQDR